MNNILKKLILAVFTVLAVVGISNQVYADLPVDGSVYIDINMRDPGQWGGITCPSFEIQVNDEAAISVSGHSTYIFSPDEAATWEVGTEIKISNVEIPDGYITEEGFENSYTYTLTEEDYEIIQSAAADSYTGNYVDISYQVGVHDTSLGIVTLSVYERIHTDWTSFSSGWPESYDIKIDDSDYDTVTGSDFYFPLEETLSWEPGTVVSVCTIEFADEYVQPESAETTYTYTITEEDCALIQAAYSGNSWDGSSVDIYFQVDVYDSEMLEETDFSVLNDGTYSTISDTGNGTANGGGAWAAVILVVAAAGIGIFVWLRKRKGNSQRGA